MAEKIGKGPNRSYFGDRPMSIQGKFLHERERLHQDMTMEEREWREKWCKDQELAPDEPKWVPEMDRQLANPIQRLYKTPLNWLFFQKLEPIIGPHAAYVSRRVIPNGILAYLVILATWYSFKYHESNWERAGGWIHKWAKPAIFPGDPGWPEPISVPHRMHASRGFNERNVFKNLAIDGTSSRTSRG